ncbi:MAG: glycosyltransferase family 4 protein [Candidatus Aminicenantaceae bacterium]
MKARQFKVLIDAREFIHGRATGIGRYLEGLTDALAEADIINEISLAVSSSEAVPLKLKNRRKIKKNYIKSSFFKSEKKLSNLSKQEYNLFISPYPKFPLFGVQCKAVHIIHDVLDLTHPAYRKRFRKLFDRFRLNSALKKASLTWYDSSWSLEETKKHFGYAGKNPRVRYPGLDENLKSDMKENEDLILSQHKLEPGYILVLGNGLPHKNLGILLEIEDMLSRKIVFIGVPKKNQKFWKSKHPSSSSKWMQFASEEALPVIIKRAFCIAQPSTAEGYGYPPLEAMACGVPAVVSKIPVLIETTGGNASFCDPGNSNEWIEAFRSLENKSIYQNQIAKGLRWIKPHIGKKGWGRHISDLEELLSKAN